MMKPGFNVKREESHKWTINEFDPVEHPDAHNSDRQKPIGYGSLRALIDKIVLPINKCPHCKKDRTFHKWIQSHSDLIGNCWRFEVRDEPKGVLHIKWDFCLNCQREFLIEIFLFEKCAFNPFLKKHVDSFVSLNKLYCKIKKSKNKRGFVKKVLEYLT